MVILTKSNFIGQTSSFTTQETEYLHITFRGHSKSMFAQDFQVLTPPPPSPLLALVCFQAPPLKEHLFWVELFLSPSISIFVKFREQEFIMSTSVSG